MKTIAAILIIWVFAGSTVLWFVMEPNGEWRLEESSTTGLCYEVRESITIFGKSAAMSQIDDSYCEEKP